MHKHNRIYTYKESQHSLNRVSWKPYDCHLICLEDACGDAPPPPFKVGFGSLGQEFWALRGKLFDGFGGPVGDWGAFGRSFGGSSASFLLSVGALGQLLALFGGLWVAFWGSWGRLWVSFGWLWGSLRGFGRLLGCLWAPLDICFCTLGVKGLNRKSR